MKWECQYDLRAITLKLLYAHSRNEAVLKELGQENKDVDYGTKIFFLM